MNEYNCWLQERTVEKPAGLTLHTVYAEHAGEVGTQAVEEFRQGIKRLLGFSPGIFPTGPGDKPNTLPGV
jgi:hypothetical protein